MQHCVARKTGAESELKTKTLLLSMWAFGFGLAKKKIDFPTKESANRNPTSMSRTIIGLGYAWWSTLDHS